MSALAKILLYLVLVLLLGSLLSPGVAFLVQHFAGHGIPASLAQTPFHRVFSRTTQIVAFLLLPILLLQLGLRSSREFGLAPNLHPWRDLAVGLVLAIFPVVILGACYLKFDLYHLKRDLPISALFRIVLTAGFVAVVEEFLFRGVLLGLAARAFGRLAALLGVSLIFAFVHFLKSTSSESGPVTWLSGFQEIGAIFHGFPAPALFFFAFLSLFFVALILGLAALRTRSLWLPIGLHAGWVFALQTLQWLAKFRVKPDTALLPWVGPNLISGGAPTGLFPLLALLLSGLAVWFYLRHDSAHRSPRSL